MWQYGGSMGYSKKSSAWKNEDHRAHHELELIAEELGYLREVIGELQDALHEGSAGIAQGVELLQAYYPPSQSRCITTARILCTNSRATA